MKFLTPAEFSALLAVPEPTVRALALRGELPGAYRVGSRWRIDLDEFRAGAKALPPVRWTRRALPRDFLARVADSMG